VHVCNLLADTDVDVPLLSEGMIGSSLLLQYFCCTGYLLACALIDVSADFSMFGVVCCSVLSSYLLLGFIDGRLWSLGYGIALYLMMGALVNICQLATFLLLTVS